MRDHVYVKRRQTHSIFKLLFLLVRLPLDSKNIGQHAIIGWLCS